MWPFSFSLKATMKTQWLLNGTAPNGFPWKGGECLQPSGGGLLEIAIGEPNYLYTWWLSEALRASKSVARVKLPSGSATGFLITDDILMTNHHVLENEQDALRAEVQFNYSIDRSGNPDEKDVWRCIPQEIFRTSQELDYTIVRVSPLTGVPAERGWGYLSIDPSLVFTENQRLNIIQHPEGRFKQIACRENQLKYEDEKVIQYITDTEYGSSGSPVFDDWFNLVALHSQRVRHPSNPNKWYRNQGIKINVIMADIGDILRQGS
jgi:endonuclease G